MIEYGLAFLKGCIDMLQLSLVLCLLNSIILEPGSMMLADFRNQDIVKSFSNPGFAVGEQINNIMTRQIGAPMFNITFFPWTGK